MRYPANLESITEWEQQLDASNASCLVPSDVLTKAFKLTELGPILQRKLTGMNAVNYQTPTGQISNRYINDGWLWAQVLKNIPFSSCVELCPGKSIVIDLALAFNEFKGVLTKIDYKSWDHNNPCELKKNFTLKNLDLNVLTQTDKIPTSELFLLNHVIDDLFMGLWGERHQCDFFAIFGNWEEVDKCWNQAMEEGIEQAYPILQRFLHRLTLKLKGKGHLILRDYPSAYETTRKQFERTNFCRNLTLLLVQELKNSGLKLLNSQDNTFFIFKK